MISSSLKRLAAFAAIAVLPIACAPGASNVTPSGRGSRATQSGGPAGGGGGGAAGGGGGGGATCQPLPGTCVLNASINVPARSVASRVRSASSAAPPAWQSPAHCSPAVSGRVHTSPSSSIPRRGFRRAGRLRSARHHEPCDEDRDARDAARRRAVLANTQRNADRSAIQPGPSVRRSRLVVHRRPESPVSRRRRVVRSGTIRFVRANRHARRTWADVPVPRARARHPRGAPVRHTPSLAEVDMLGRRAAMLRPGDSSSFAVR